MKKIIFTLLLILFLTTIVYAESMQLQYDGETHIYEGPNVNLMLNGEIFVPSEKQMPPIIFKDRTLVPVREVFEKLGGEVYWAQEERAATVKFGEKSITVWIDKTTAIVNNEEIELDVPAKLINEKTMVPVRFISENGNLNVGWDESTTTVTISKPVEEKKISNITAVTISKIKGIECVVVELDNKTTYKAFELAQEGMPYKIIMDINDSNFEINRDPIVFPENDFLSQIRFGIHENNVNRLVLDMNKETEYSVFETEEGKKVYIAFAAGIKIEEELPSEGDEELPPPNEDVEPPIDEVGNGDEVNNPSEGNTQIPETPNDEAGDEIPREEPEKKEFLLNVTSVKYSTASEKVRILLDKKFEYELTTLEDPNRLIIDFSEAALKLEGPSVITLKNNPISTIESVSNEDGSARIIITMSDKATYDLSNNTAYSTPLVRGRCPRIV